MQGSDSVGLMSRRAAYTVYATAAIAATLAALAGRRISNLRAVSEGGRFESHLPHFNSNH